MSFYFNTLQCRVEVFIYCAFVYFLTALVYRTIQCAVKVSGDRFVLAVDEKIILLNRELK